MIHWTYRIQVCLLFYRTADYFAALVISHIKYYLAKHLLYLLFRQKFNESLWVAVYCQIALLFLNSCYSFFFISFIHKASPRLENREKPCQKNTLTWLQLSACLSSIIFLSTNTIWGLSLLTPLCKLLNPVNLPHI